jgi:hypothetical protein
MSAPAPDGGATPMMAMVGAVVRSPTVLAGWLYHLVNSAVIGALFGWLLGGRVRSYPSGLLWGLGYGLVWWVLGGLLLMPVLLGMPAFAPLLMAPMVPVAIGSLVGHLLFGAITGTAYVALTGKAAVG